MLKDDGVDPQGGKLYSRYERVRVEKVWKETLDKEAGLFQEARAAHPGPPAYVMNLANAQRHGLLTALKHSHQRLEIIADKVEKASPQERMSEEGFDPNSFDINAVKHTLKKPTQKYDLPCTRAQEIGWLIATQSSAKAIRRAQQTKRYPEAEALGFTSPPKALAKSASDSSLLLSDKASPHQPVATSKNKDLLELNRKRKNLGKTFCDITLYADNYVATKHHNPFNQALAGR
eukprot:TRINITY_DN27850_c0_g1_i1.p1 TRINITY_DN27850_c0_g1~~TRINITY_DN27850_c0_g1_i1.p1  ORF type:complete len:233 (-),score=41.56 TRINITY_DN27850_c0_g1_i1:112-810(-)